MKTNIFLLVAGSLLCVALTASATSRYVNLNNLAPVLPYTNWVTAATTIQDAVDAAVAGDEIVVTNGVYATGGPTVYFLFTCRVAITKAVTVRSVNGPLVTVIGGQAVAGTTNGDGAIRCVYVGENAVLSGFTLNNGHTRLPGQYVTSWETTGGGAWCQSSAIVSNCILSGNSAGQEGGGVAGGTLNNCTLSGNVAGQEGGGVAGGTLNNCTLSNNSANSGGGAYIGTLNNCTLSGNSADMGGGTSYATLNSCTLSGNSASDRGGGANGGTLNNCTLSGNSATSGGGVFQGNLNNCIVYYNSAASGPNYVLATYLSSTINYSCTTPLPPGPGNIASETLLASCSHLSAQSSCIGRGSSTYSSGVDIDGEAWLNPPCMGADQLLAGQATGGLTVAIAAAYTNIGSGFAVLFTAQINGRLTGSVWDFGDGVVVSNRPYTSHAWAAPGSYLVRLTGYNDSWPGGVSATVRVQVGAREVYYVNGSNAGPRYPYTNWVTAATDIQAAIDAGVQMGRLVLVTDGAYSAGGRAVYGQMINRVVVAEGVEVRSLNGPLVTRIEGGAVARTTNGDGAIRCAYVGTNAVLSGFTLTNGHTHIAPLGTPLPAPDKEFSGGSAWCELSGVVSNCTLIGNSADQFGGGAYGGTLNNCVLMDNSASGGGGVAGGTLNNCTLSGNSAAGGGGADSATLNNCTVRGNSASRNGGGALGGTLNNCTLSGNSASGDGGGVSESTLNNCIVYYNSAPSGPNYGVSSTFSYSCTAPMPTNGLGNLTQAPLFIDPNGWSNLRLQAASPCINAGNNAAVVGASDLDGNPRISGGTVDIGAYEYQLLDPFHAWLAQYGLPTDGSADYADPDDDGMNNWQEWVAGTNPTNALSALWMLSATGALARVTVTWSSVPDRTYALERATDLGVASAFSLLRSNIAGQPGRTSFTDTNSLGSMPCFYRVRVEN